MLLKEYIALEGLSNWKHIILAEYLLIAAFLSSGKGIDRITLVENNTQ